MRRKVIQLTPYYPPHLGGVERVAEALAKGLAPLHDVEVWTSDVGVDDRVTGCAQEFPVHRLHAYELAHTPVPMGLWRRLKALPENSVVHVHVAQALWPDLVALAAMRGHFHFVAHFHLDVDPSGAAGFLLPLYKQQVLARTLRSADAVIALTQSQADHLVEQYQIDRERVHLFENGVDDAYFGLRPTSRPNDAPLRLLFVGRMELQKNLPRLLRALALVEQSVDVVLVGDGSERKMCESLRDRLELHHVRFVGAQHGDELLSWYEWADLFVLSSDREGMPLALLEAMAAGLAVLVTDVSDLRDQLGDSGLAVPANDEDLAKAIDELAGDRTRVESMRIQSRRRGSQYTWGASIDRLNRLYESFDR